MITNIWKTGFNNDENESGNNQYQYYITDTFSSIKRLTIQRGTGTVGIDTNTPISIVGANVKLDVNGSINLSGNIYKNGVLYVGNSTIWSENYTKTQIYYTSGNVGINNSDPIEVLDINGNIKAINVIANGQGLTNLNASEIKTGTINTDRLPQTISVANFIGSGEYLYNLNATNIKSGKINNSVLPSTINVLSFKGNGQGLTNLDASKILSGNISNSRLPANISVSTLTGSGIGITNLLASNITGNIPNSKLPINISVSSLSGNGLNITNLNASNINFGKITSSVFLPDNINVQSLSGDGNALSNLDSSKISIINKLNNSIFNNDITIAGKLTVGDLEVSGNSTIISTGIYQTENLEIVNNNPSGSTSSFIINHNSIFNDLIRILSNSTRIFTILKNGNVGIGGTTFPNSNYKLDVEGNINSTNTISSQIVSIRDNINLYKSSTQSVLIKLPQTLTSYTITLPNSGPSINNNVLKSDSSGNLSWVNINESITLTNVYSLFDNTEFEKTTINIKLKNINSNKLISSFDNTQFELPPIGDPQIIRIKDNVLISNGNNSITSINDPPSIIVNNIDIVDNDIPLPIVSYTYYMQQYLQMLAEKISNANGWRLVRYLPPTSNRWYNTNNDNLEGLISYGRPYDYNNEFSVPFGDFDEFLFSTKGMNHWLQVSKIQAIGSNYDNSARTIIKSSISSSSYTANWYNRSTALEDPWIGLRSHGTQPINYPERGGDLILYSEYDSTTHWSNPAISIDGGMCVFVRKSTDVKSSIIEIPQVQILNNNYQIYTYTHNQSGNPYDGSAITAQTYNVSFSEPVIADILVVAGGGGGGAYGGGGGGGDVLYFSGVQMNGNYTINVGNGGKGTGTRGHATHGGGWNGENSSLSGNGLNIVAGGGGGGGSFNASALAGTLVTFTDPITGSLRYSSGGGGGSIVDNQLASGNIVSGDGAPNSGNQQSGGGGGGSGGMSNGFIGTAPLKNPSGIGGDGGFGYESDISGILTQYGGGGGGGDWTEITGSWAFGYGRYGGGNGSIGGNIPEDGIPHTGGGGGGAGTGNGTAGKGGSGIVIIRYYVISSITHKYLELNYQPYLNFTFRIDESPYSWQEAYDEAIANGKRIPTKKELREYLKYNQNSYRNIDAWCPVIAPEYSNGKDWIQLGTGGTANYPGKSHMEVYGYPSWDNSSNEISKYYCEVSPINTGHINTKYIVNFPINTTCDILTINNSQYFKTNGVVLNGSYNIIVGATTKIQKNNLDLYTPNTNLNTTDNITGKTITYRANTPIVVIKYSIGTEPIITDIIKETIERMYPPTRTLASASHTISGQSYGNGVYETWQSTYSNILYRAYSAFQTSETVGFHAAENQYSNGNYLGSNYIFPGYTGDWIKIKLPVSIKLTKYGFKKRYANGETFVNYRAPGQYKIYGSNDNNQWDVLVHKTTEPSYTSQIYVANDYFEESISISNTYQYFAVVVNKLTLAGQTTSWGGVLNFDEWYIYGMENVLTDVSKQLPTTDVINYQYHILTFEGTSGSLSADGNQRIHTIDFPDNVVADILIVGGGGGGGNHGAGNYECGGGGGGAFQYIKNIMLLKGVYTIKVGNGGSPSGKGYSSEFKFSNDILINCEGGGAGSGTNGIINSNNNGGSGGGGQFGYNNFGIANDPTKGFNGDKGTTNSGINEGGGGGGAGGPGRLKYGGIGKICDILGGVNYYAGGGGGCTYSSITRGDGGLGGGGKGSNSSLPGENGLNGTGGGGGGGYYIGPKPAGRGGSGIVIIRYYYVLKKITHKYLALTYTGTTENDTTYQVNFPTNTSCDILVVGGGGGGGQQNAGGGGAGGLVLIQNFTANGTYNINVGKGGNGGINQSRGQQGANTTFTKTDNSVIITANGGGGGGSTGLEGQGDGLKASNGGSGGGGGYIYENGIQTQKSQYQIGIISPTILNQFGEDGGHGGGVSAASYPGGGGGGAGSVGETSSSNETGQNGGRGIDRVGTFVFSEKFSSSIGHNGWFAGGGGSSGNSNDGYGNGGITLYGGGGKGSGGISTSTTGMNGINGTGGGGGGWRSPGTTPGGNGGSGIVIVRYNLISAITTITTNANIVPTGYLKFDNNSWNVEYNGILTSKILHDQICMSRYLSNNNYSMINIYEYSVINDVGVSSNWITINNKDIIYIAKSGYAGAYPTYQNNFVGNILKIRLKSCSLENVYKSFLIDHNSYIHNINCTIKNIYTGGILYNSQDININNATFFSSPELFTNGINLSTNSIPTNVKLLLELKLFVSFDASTNSTTTIKQQTDKFYLFYEEF